MRRNINVFFLETLLVKHLFGRPGRRWEYNIRLFRCRGYLYTIGFNIKRNGECACNVTLRCVLGMLFLSDLDQTSVFSTNVCKPLSTLPNIWRKSAQGEPSSSMEDWTDVRTNRHEEVYRLFSRLHEIIRNLCTVSKSFICIFIWLSEQTVIISLYIMNWLVFMIETECVPCAVWTEPLNIAWIHVSCTV
jgi:hypothetical protein